MNRCHTYNRCNKKGKVLCVIQYKFNVLVNSPLASINTNYTLLATSSSTSTNDTNVKAAIEADATSGKKKLYKTLYTMNLHLYMHLDILKKCNEMIKNIVLTYSDI